MAKILLNLESELKAKLQTKAKAANRTMTSHIIHIIERDLNTFEIPFEGVVSQDGTIKFRKYWNSPEGADEIAGRGQ
jgi:hypothetical protein